MNTYPFWDFVNDMNARQGRHGGHHNEFQTWNQPYGGPGFPFGQMPHRGRHGPPPSPPAAGPSVPLPPSGSEPPKRDSSPPPHPGTPGTPPEEAPHDPKAPRSRGPSPPPGHNDDNPDCPWDHHERRHHGRCGFGHGGHHHGPPPPGRFPHHGPPPFGGRHGRRGRRGRHGPAGPPPDYNGAIDLTSVWAQMPYYVNQIPEMINNFVPGTFPAAMNVNKPVPAADDREENLNMIDVDVFNMEESYVIHVSMAGAKKQDVNVSYELNKHLVIVSGVIQRPAEVDEIMLNELTQRERRIGFFERKIYLDGPHNVDAESMTAKLEDGVLRIELPKEREEEWTEVKKVQVK